MFNFLLPKNSDSRRFVEMSTLSKLNLPPLNECVYTPCFCEENVWKLCEHVKLNQIDFLPQCFVVFISNKNETTPLWYQKAETDAEKPVIWDYHVIFIYEPLGDGEALVYDLDSVLPYPTAISVYSSLALKCDNFLKPEYHRLFRVMSAEAFLNNFASDRSRMKRSDGTWIKPPPMYPCISTKESMNNIEDYISMNPERGIGSVMTLEDFHKRFCAL